MFDWIIRKIIGTKNQRAVKKLWPLVHQINEIESRLQAESEDSLRARTAQWQERFRAFHEPRFLQGVWLRIADDAQLDECLRGVSDKFERLKEYFPALDTSLVAESSWQGESAEAKKDRIVRAREAYIEVAPGFGKIEQGILADILPGCTPW
jgi:preprotein translocase subunit SecA